MAKVKQYSITWTKSASIDVVGYKIYYIPEEELLDYGSPSVLVGDVDTVLIPDDTPGFPFIDGNYKIGLTAVDDVGNESDFQEKIDPFELVAPDVPADLEVTAV